MSGRSTSIYSRSRWPVLAVLLLLVFAPVAAAVWGDGAEDWSQYDEVRQSINFTDHPYLKGDYVCWNFVKDFLQNNTGWGELVLGTGYTNDFVHGYYWENCHSVAWKRIDNNTICVWDGSTHSDMYFMEFDENGNIYYWNYIKNGIKRLQISYPSRLYDFSLMRFELPDTEFSPYYVMEDNRDLVIS